MHSGPASDASASPFGGYRLAFYILFGAVVAELIAAALVGHLYRGTSLSTVFRIGDVTLGLSGWFLIPLVWLGLVAVSLARRKADRPTLTIFRIVRRNRDWLIRGSLLAIIHIPLGRAFATFKTSIPFIQPYSWDGAFADLDQALFGVDPWRLTHALIGDGGTVIIDRIYALWGTYLILLAGWISFTRNRALQIKAALAFNMCWLVLGTLLATYFASVGPCFFEAFHASDRFAPLMSGLARVHEDHTLLAVMAMNYVTETAGTPRLGSGISAMPSLHVSMATLGVIAAFAAGARRWVKVLAIAFAAVILVGSVHLGWHYAVDGLASIALTGVVWHAVGWFVDATRPRGSTAKDQCQAAI